MRFSSVFGIGLYLRARKFYRAFEEATRRLRATQERVLLEKIRRNEDSDFGRERDFRDIRSVEDFRRRLPVAAYGDFEPYIEEVKRGNAAAMFGPDEKVLMFALTSGTHGKRKFIPVTRTFLSEYRVGWHVWGSAVTRDHMPAYDYSILRVVSPSAESYTEAGIPCGAISGLMTEALPWPIRRKYIPLPGTAAVKRPPGRYYLIARIAVTQKVSMMSTANPDTILSVVRAVDENRETVIRDLYDGTVDGSREITGELPRSLHRRLSPHRRRAMELERIVSRTGRLLPKDYWPELRLVGNWKGGACGAYLLRYPEYFGDVPVRDIGLLATEGRMTIPLTDEGSSGVLDIWSQFYEFIPEEEMKSGNPTVLSAHELEAGRNYFIVLTTSGGLYRYNIMDLVRVTGFFNETPELMFLNKGKHFSSVIGEKISEFQVVESMKRARSLLKSGPENGILSPMLGDPPGYSLAVERQDGCSREFWRKFLSRFEEHLRSMNYEYESRRSASRLGPPVLHILRAGTFKEMKDAHLEKTGSRAEQYKHCFIVREIDHHKTLPAEDCVTLGTENGPDN